eukprot:evm.model.scf_964EXC.5 EVM.evm.TU.scf_964EXC.5   scf_964EXC:24652-26607(-)
MRRVISAPSLTDLGPPPAVVSRPLSATLSGAEGRAIGDAAAMAQAVASRKLFVNSLPGNAALMAHGPQSTPRASVRTCAVVLPKMSLSEVAPVVTEFSKDLGGVAKSVEDEVVVESGLHVVGVAAGGCVQRFGIASKLAPSLVDGDQTNLSTENELALAMCMATPFEGEEDGLHEEIQRSLDDMALQNEVLIELEYALDSLTNVSLSDTEGQALSRLRTVGNRRRRRPIHFGGGIAKSADTSSVGNGRGKENKDAHGNIVATSGLDGLLRKAVAPRQST